MRDSPKASAALIRFSRLWRLASFFGRRRYRVEGDSMAPAFRSGRQVSIDRNTYRHHPPSRLDVVLFRAPALEGKALLKRIVGLPGEMITLAQGRVHVNGEPLEEPYVAEGNGLDPALDLEWGLGPDEYLVLGDNRGDSLDSRRLGPVRSTWIEGKAREG